MNLSLSEDQAMLADEFRKFFGDLSSMERVRKAEEEGGFDRELWQAIGEMGALAMRLPGEDGFGTFDAGLVAFEAGRQLVSGPLIEGMLASRLLAQLQAPDELLERASTGDAVVTLALAEASSGPQIVPGGAIADAVLVLDGAQVKLARPSERASPENLAGQPIVSIDFSECELENLEGSNDARSLFLAALEEWKLLTAAHLTGMGLRALELAGDYAKEREQFGRPIATFQAIAHPLADMASEMTGSDMLWRWAITEIAQGGEQSTAAAPMAYWFAAQASSQAVYRAQHTFGGYGLALEYDIQLYVRRARAVAAVLGDPRDQLIVAGKRLWLDETSPLPEVGSAQVEFGYGEEAVAFAEETRTFFQKELTQEYRDNAHFSYDGHDWDLNKKMGKARLLFPSWPIEHGGRGLDDLATAAALQVWEDEGVTSHSQYVSNLVGHSIIHFGSDELKADIVPRLADGEIISCLGFSEPHSGSDVFAAKTKARQADDGSGDWIIDGQKMWTSGANLAHHVFLLARTDHEAPKHRGMTVFLVPLDDPGVEIHPVHTFQDERTNATFYENVRVPDSYRIGPVNGGLEVMGFALTIEQGGGGFVGPHRHAVEAAVEWAEEAGRIVEPRVLERIAAAATRNRASYLLYWRALHLKAEGGDRAAGPMSKLYGSESLLKDAVDLFELAAPDTLIRGKHGAQRLEHEMRHASVTTVYGGTSEVHRSQVAEAFFGLPKSR
ncbi:acyl-CoA dehydrogenase [Erythrobacter litoralis]|uniref:acyl-CoA dehydrogenase n=1 Tax=Erythrobacter litoralis TaxID=39960 RepID=UPI00243563C7|nr:acyl-CoA dehydrogenase [Erythrobacter litoralis]MDG6079868.1 acyl-CoA dehydrogenase [Erythrobacter litoralis]